MTCDQGEPQAITTRNGKFTIKTDGSTNYPLFVEVTPDVIDEDDNQTVGGTYTLSAPVGETFVSPISTMVQQRIANGETVAQARSQVAMDLNILRPELVYSDYIAWETSEAISVHKKAQIIARLKKEIERRVTGEENKKALQTYINEKMLSTLPDVRTAYEASENIEPSILVSNVMNYVNLSDAQSELSRIKESYSEKDDNDSGSSGTTITDLLKGSIIEKDKNYSYTYKGGTDLKRFEIANSTGERCTFRKLDTTAVYNPYADAFSISGTREPSSKLLDYSAGENSSFLLAWTYYTTEGSKLDFKVTCEPYTPPTTNTDPITIESLGFENTDSSSDFNGFERVESVSRTSMILYKTGLTPSAVDGIRTVTMTNREFDVKSNLYDWTGLAVLVNDVAVGSLVYTADTTLGEVDDIVFTIDFNSNTVNVVMEGAQNTIESFGPHSIDSNTSYVSTKYVYVRVKDGVAEYYDNSYSSWRK